MKNGVEIREQFAGLYGGEPRVHRAPGRVNLIGEHTDYNDGFVMPAAIDRYTFVAASPREDRKLIIHSVLFSETIERSLDDLQPSKNWSDYVVGVAAILEQTGYRLKGADLLIDSEVPIGSGLSSSAALEVSSAYALLDIAGIVLDPLEIAKLCQRAENEFVGMRCGIMDQLISACGQAEHAMFLDCRSLAYRLLPLNRSASSLVVCNSMVKHELAQGEYNKRRAACEEGVRIIARSFPDVRALRDVSHEQLERCREELPEVIYRRCRHVVTENARVLKAAASLESGDLKRFGELMGESHRSLRDDYEVSCRELDLLVELAANNPGVYGARMTGGGFGGCTINLVQPDSVETFRGYIGTEYERQSGIHPEIYICIASDGAGSLS